MRVWEAPGWLCSVLLLRTPKRERFRVKVFPVDTFEINLNWRSDEQRVALNSLVTRLDARHCRLLDPRWRHRHSICSDVNHVAVRRVFTTVRDERRGWQSGESSRCCELLHKFIFTKENWNVRLDIVELYSRGTIYHTCQYWQKNAIFSLLPGRCACSDNPTPYEDNRTLSAISTKFTSAPRLFDHSQQHLFDEESQALCTEALNVQ